MKIKKRYYCLIDNNNKPDFRYLFTNKSDAEKKRKEIKNSIVGETLFVSQNKRDFFVDGVRKKFIGQNKPINIKRGCWVTLRTKQLFILDTIEPKVYFENIIHNTEQIIVNSAPIATTASSTTTTSVEDRSISHQPRILTQQTAIRKATTESLTNSKRSASQKKRLKFLWLLDKSNVSTVFKTKTFAFNFAIVLLLCIASVIYLNNKSHRELADAIATKQEKITKEVAKPTSDKVAVLGAMKEKGEEEEINNDLDRTVFETLQEFDKIKTEKLAEKIQQMVAGTPMEQMVPYIAQQDKIVAAFLVGIAKKESNYGRRVPVLNGKDCYNYWGYRGIRKRMGTGGHTCFDSPEDAVKTVGGRISRLVKSGVDTPQEMVLWKCGSDCNSTGGWPAAHKWISDVNLYYSKMINLTNEDDSPKDNQIDPDDDEKQVLSLQG